VVALLDFFQQLLHKQHVRLRMVKLGAIAKMPVHVTH